MLFDSHIKQLLLGPDEKGPLVLETQKKDLNPFEWVKENKVLLEDMLLKYGDLL